MYQRIFNVQQAIKNKSLFLVGPRQTGKSTFITSSFPNAKYYNLLAADTFRELAISPELMRQRLGHEDKIVIIDEIQKLPNLLDEVHLLIEQDKSRRFILTGSSARKLRRGGVNLLAGRASFFYFHPLVSAELEFQRLTDRLNYGSLPFIIDAPDPKLELRDYVGEYLQEEIRAEALTRSVENFSRFLQVAALTNAEQVDYQGVSSDAMVPVRTVMEYYQVLVDTLLGYQLPSFRKTEKRKAVAKPKFYFFDIGVANILAKRGHVEPRSELYGKALEHLIFLELRTYLDYHRLDRSLSYWRTYSKFEVDFIIDDEIAIEVKACEKVSSRDLKGMKALSEEVTLKRKIVVSNEREHRKTDENIEIFPIELFLRQLWSGLIIG